MKTVELRVGQIWCDNDSRRSKRNIKIVSMISIKNHNKMVLAYNTQTGKETVIKESRFKPFSRGYRLVKNVRKK